jgi:hypothetical protein
VTQFAIVLPRCIVSESVLSFPGLGVSPETPTWGRMISADALSLAVMRHGRIIEVAPTATLLSAPGHPDTARLLAARLAPASVTEVSSARGRAVPETLYTPQS